jgi:hypothetical protein
VAQMYGGGMSFYTHPPFRSAALVRMACQEARLASHNKMSCSQWLRLLDFGQALGKGSSPLPLTPRKPERGRMRSAKLITGTRIREVDKDVWRIIFGTHALPPHRQVVRCYLLLGLTILGVCRSATRSCARTCCVALRRCRSACRAADGPAAGGA